MYAHTHIHVYIYIYIYIYIHVYLFIYHIYIYIYIYIHNIYIYIYIGWPRGVALDVALDPGALAMLDLIWGEPRPPPATKEIGTPDPQ